MLKLSPFHSLGGWSAKKINAQVKSRIGTAMMSMAIFIFLNSICGRTSDRQSGGGCGRAGLHLRTEDKDESFSRTDRTAAPKDD